MSQVAHSITHSLSSSPPDPPPRSHILRQHHLNNLHIGEHLTRSTPSPTTAAAASSSSTPAHSKSFSLAGLGPSPPGADHLLSKHLPSASPKPNLHVDRPPPEHPTISSFHFPLLNLSSPTPPPADKTDYFDQFPASHPPKSSPRPLHQKAQSETAMRLELPRSFPSSSALSHIPMLRKKSGEVVRSSLKLGPSSPRPSVSSSTYSSTRSAPSTPISGPKAVHFDSHLEHVRHFLSQQRPMAVSRDGSPIETETEGEEEYPFPDMGYAPDGTRRSPPANRTKLIIELTNMPLADRPHMVVCLKTLELSAEGKNLVGTVAVENLSFEKRVAVRFTFDKWQTVSEVTADYLSSCPPPSTSSSHHQSRRDEKKSIDLFGFTIKLQDVLARIEEREMEIAVRYRAAGGEYWDNNSGSNYHVRFKHLRLNNHPTASSQQQVPATNSSQKSSDPCPWAVTLRAELDRLVGDDLGLSMSQGIKKKLNNNNSTYGSPDPDILTPKVTRLKPGKGLSARYDFSSSLKQAASGSVKQASNRFEELVLPFPVSPVPIEWLGVMPVSNDGPSTSTAARRNSVDTTTNSSNTKNSYNKRWTLPGLVHLPHLPPSPPQDPSTPTTVIQSHTPASTTSHQKQDHTCLQFLPPPASIILNQHHCPSGLVTPHSPSLTDDST